MKLFSKLLVLLLVFIACKPVDPDIEYKYEDAPHYGWGYAEYYGPYYADYNNNNNVLSLSLFSDSLKINENFELTGLGQYLYIEDIFIPDNKSVLPVGTYVCSSSEKPFTFLAGQKFPVDDVTINTGAFMYYLEKTKAFTVMKHITRGSFNVNIVDNKYVIDCDFVLSDSSKVQGSFSADLPHIDQSTAILVEAPRNRVKLPM